MDKLLQKPDFSKSRNYMSWPEALMFNERVLKRWKPSYQVWPFAYGDDFLSCWTALGSLYITHYFRKELKLRPYARITCYSPTVGVSAVGTFIFQSGLITYDILKAESCPLCITTKATIGQLFIGLGYPLVVAPIVCFYLADKILTYPVPPLLKAPREVFRLFSKIVQKNPRPFLVIGAVHMLAASFITFQKQICLINLELESKAARKVV